MNVGGGVGHVVQCFVEIVDRQQVTTRLEVEDILFAGHTEPGVLDGGDQQRRLRALPLNGFGGDPGRRGDLRECRARVAVSGEQFGGRSKDPRPRRLRLLLTQR